MECRALLQRVRRLLLLLELLLMLLRNLSGCCGLFVLSDSLLTVTWGRRRWIGKPRSRIWCTLSQPAIVIILHLRQRTLGSSEWTIVLVVRFFIGFNYHILFSLISTSSDIVQTLVLLLLLIYHWVGVRYHRPYVILVQTFVYGREIDVITVFTFVALRHLIVQSRSQIWRHEIVHWEVIYWRGLS